MSRAMDGYIQNEARGIGNSISFFNHSRAQRELDLTTFANTFA